MKPDLISEEPTVALTKILADDAKYRTQRDLDNSIALLEYYENRAGERTKTANRLLGAGPREDVDYRPLQIGLLRYAIDRQAVVYSRPPTRWLQEPGGARLSSSHAQTVLMRDVYRKSLVDLALRSVDRRSNLLTVVGLRVYGVGDRLDLRVFTPDLIRRSPNPAVQTDCRLDNGFALKLSHDQWEMWRPYGGAWHFTVLAGSEVVDEGDTDVLPFMLVYEQFQHHAWPRQRDDRLASCEVINAMGNDLWANVHHETHNTRVWLGAQADQIPEDRGPGKEIAIPDPNVKVQDLTPKPQINASIDTLEQVVRLTLIGEDLPPDDLDKNKQVVTGAALRTRLFGLIERRNAQAMLSPHNESTLYQIIATQYNMLQLGRSSKRLDASLHLDLELAPMDLPTEAAQQSAALSKDIELGIKSHIEAVSESRGIDRDAAVKVLTQIHLDEAEGRLSKDGALLGPQVDSLVNIVAQVSGGVISREAAIAIIVLAFGVDNERAASLVGPKFTATPPETPAKPAPTPKPTDGTAKV